MNEVRSNIDVKHKVWHDMTVTLGEKVDASESQLPRRCGHQTARSNIPGDTPESYYRRTNSIPFLDELITHLKSRFTVIQQKAVMGMTIATSVLMDETIPTSSLGDLLQQYSDDLDYLVLRNRALAVEMQVELFLKPLLDTPTDALLYASQSMFPNVHSLLRLICTLPVTSVNVNVALAFYGG